jgi:hypothetical protein
VKTFGIAPRRAGLTLAVLATALVVAACGSSSSTTTTSTNAAASGAATKSARASRASLRTCLAQHGVKLPNFRRQGTTGPGGPGGPPGGGGGGLFGGGGGAGAGAGAGPGQFANPKVRAAIQACGGFRGGRPGAGRRFQISHTAITNFVTCVRKHGYPQMPNPNFGGGAIFPASLRKNAKFVSASKVCASVLIPRRTATGQTGPGA